jgi:hypothetical protein
MRFALAALALSASLLPAQAQTPLQNPFMNMFQMQNPAQAQKPGRGRGHHHSGASASRACLTAQTRAVLAQMEGQFGPVKVISTCRPGAVIAGSGRPSQHRYGKAVDFVPPPGRRAAMMQWLRGRAGGAVITYRSGHVHFDTGSSRYVGCGDCGSRQVRNSHAQDHGS